MSEPDPMDSSSDEEEVAVASPKRSDPSPRVGGIIRGTPWVGGSSLNPRSKPKSTLAWRPDDFRSANKVEESCQVGLKENRHLGSEMKTSKVSLTTWVDSIKEYMEDRGMDTVFRIVIKPTSTTQYESYMLEDWSVVKNEDIIENWVNHLKQLKCPFDADNLYWSGRAVINSITLEFWETLEKDLPTDASGPEVFAAVVRKQQQLNASGLRMLVKQLEGMSLEKEPGQDVDAFGNKVSEVARRISRGGNPPEDLSVLVARAFLKSDVEVFCLKANGIFDEVDDDPTTMTWQTIISKLKKKYISLKSQELWTPAHNKKKNEVNEIAALKNSVQLLQNQMKGSGSNTTEGGGQKKDLSQITCYECGEKGHYKNKCPKRENKDGSNNSNSDNKSSQSAPKSWKRVPPKDGESEKKTVEGTEWIWCGRCKRWKAGSKKHHTADHKTKEELQKASEGNQKPANVAAGSTTTLEMFPLNLAATDNDNPEAIYTGMGSFWMAQGEVPKEKAG